MKPKLILFYSISFWLFSFFVFGQENEVKIDSIAAKYKKRYSSFFIGADLFLPSLQFFNDRKGERIFLHYQNKEKTAWVIEGGYEKNEYNKINWLVDVNGVFLLAGINYFFLIDREQNNFNGFYVGGRLANANYQQKINQYPIYGINTSNLVGVGSLEKKNINSTWIEFVFGSRVDLIKRKLYGDISFRAKYHLSSTEQENIKPLVIPGFGVNRNNLNFDVWLSLGYQINLVKTKKLPKT